MREILFKAKRIDNGEWVEGSLVVRGEQYFIFTGETKMFGYMMNWVWHEVDPSTICQYTGLTDKNGNKIWENDIVRLYGQDTMNKYDWKAVVEFGNPNGVYWWGFQLNPIGEFEYNTDILCWIDMEEVNIYCEVIGNIFDNKELLERE